MSETIPNSHPHQKSEHSTTKSYVIGFILSLIFTVIPYYLVTQKIIVGKILLATILVIAVVQMAIQIFFFLHLGRGPKPLYNVVFFISTVGLILVVVIGSIFIMNNLHYNMEPAEITKKLAQKEGIAQVGGEETGACQEVYENYKVTVEDGKIIPDSIDARLCDSLTFINNDDKTREIAFGSHPVHDNYAGEEVLIRKGRPKTITLNDLGEFIFHDHLEPEVSGRLTVSPR